MGSRCGLSRRVSGEREGRGCGCDPGRDSCSHGASVLDLVPRTNLGQSPLPPGVSGNSVQSHSLSFVIPRSGVIWSKNPPEVS